MSDIIDVEPERVLAAEGEKSTALPAVSGRRPLPIVPRSLSETMAIATTLHRSGLAPKALQTVERVAFAILAGAEVGLPPIAALRSIMIVNGVATLWGDGLLGVIRASGHLESIRETLERDDKGVPIKATCRAPASSWGCRSPPSSQRWCLTTTRRGRGGSDASTAT